MWLFQRQGNANRYNNEQARGVILLDKKIKEVRHQSMADLVSPHTFQWLFGADVTAIDRIDAEEV